MPILQGLGKLFFLFIKYGGPPKGVGGGGGPDPQEPSPWHAPGHGNLHSIAIYVIHFGRIAMMLYAIMEVLSISQQNKNAGEILMIVFIPYCCDEENVYHRLQFSMCNGPVIDYGEDGGGYIM